MSEMVERVARGIAESFSRADPLWENWLPQARAAIAAMREPTAAMVDLGRGIGPDAPYGLAETRERWHAMIDECLK
jgi:hypothetical protein